jgi:4-amino-4-deoxy-L-arabinose transferase-like glycosyltransferase
MAAPPSKSQRKSGLSESKQKVRAVMARARTRRGLALVVLLTAFALVQVALPLRTAVQIGADEGFELAKATLCLHGYKLYSEIWNDQPPLHTFLITQIMKRLSPSILGPRLVTAVCAALLVASIYILSLRICGLWVAVLTTALLIASPGFIELSSSCMLEIPALAPAVAALAVLLVRERTRWHLAELLSGILFGMALQVKLVAMVLLPIAALILWLRDRRDTVDHRDIRSTSMVSRGGGSRRAGNAPSHVTGLAVESGQIAGKARIGGSAGSNHWFGTKATVSLLILGASLIVSFVGIDCGIDRGAFLLHFQQSWLSHFAPAKSFEYGSPNDHTFDWSILLKNWDSTVPAIVGILFAILQRGKMPATVLPVVWLTLVLMVFAKHQPWWSYYYVHIAIPLCWCAAIGMVATAQWIHHRRRLALSLVLAVLGIGAISWMGARIYIELSAIRRGPQTYTALVLREIERLKPFARFLYTDQSVYSFHSGIPMPPDLAVLSLKRFWSGDMTNSRLAAEMWAAKPEVILLRNDAREVPFQDLIDAEYRVVYQDTQHRLYTKKSLTKAAG